MHVCPQVAGIRGIVWDWEELRSPYYVAKPQASTEKNRAPWVQNFNPALGLGSGGKSISRLQFCTG